MPVSVSVYFGNFIIYISSYYHAKASSVAVWIDPLWLSSAFKILQPIGMVMSGLLERKTTLKIGIIIGVLMQSSSVILSYWTVVEPIALLATFGILQGIAGGILLALPYKLAAEAFPAKRGLAFGILSMGPSIFPLLHMVLSYYLINPDNASTDIEIDNIRYFSDSGVIDRVPSFFLKIGLFTAGLQLTGTLMIHVKRENLEPSEDNGLETKMLVESDQNDEILLSDHSVGEKGAIMSSTDDKSEFEIDKNLGQNSIDEELASEKSENCGMDLNPKDMLATCTFWKTWTIFALMGHTFFIHLNLYKQFGLTVINDDNMLVMAGTVSTFVLMIFRPVVGLLSDRFGLKPILALTCACSNVFMTMMPISLYACPPLYIVFVALEFYATSSVKVFYYMAPMALFGPTHFATNVGLMSASQWVIFFLGPIMIPPLIKSVGWTYVFMS
ncbi:unnamed protein product, partial [Lymnaea stagnalis]